MDANWRDGVTVSTTVPSAARTSTTEPAAWVANVASSEPCDDDWLGAIAMPALPVATIVPPEMFQQSDIVSLHCPLTKDNRYLINREALSLMKPGVTIVNTSRGALLNTADIIHALKTKQVGALCIDVYEQEEKLFFRDLSSSIIDDDQIQRLMSFPNVLITAHQAFFTEEALTEIAQITLDNVARLGENRMGENAPFMLT